MCFLGIAVSTCFITVNKGIAGPLPHRSRTDITPMSLLQDLKNGTRTKAQLKTALLEYMKKEAGKTEDNVTRYTPEAGRNKNVITYVGFEKDWSVINKRSLAVLKETLPKLQSQDSSIRLEGLDDLTNLMLAFEITTTPEKKQNKALRLLLGHFYFFPSLYFKEIRTESYLPERMLRIGSFHAADFFDMGKKFYPLGIEAYKRLLKAYGTTMSEQSQYVYWISWGYLQLKQYDEAITWAKKNAAVRRYDGGTRQAATMGQTRKVQAEKKEMNRRSTHDYPIQNTFLYPHCRISGSISRSFRQGRYQG